MIENIGMHYAFYGRYNKRWNMDEVLSGIVELVWGEFMGDDNCIS